MASGARCRDDRGGVRGRGTDPRSSSSTAAGLRLLVPGYAQWAWGQRERGVVLFGSFAAALAVGAFAWGRPLGLLVTAFAFGTHVVSAVDALRQSAFPALGKWAAWLTAAGWLAGGAYAPALGLAATFAWPGMRSGAVDEGYLVDRHAYRAGAPAQGDFVWYREPDGGKRLGRVIAGPEREVEWRDGRLFVEGRPLPRGSDGRSLLLGSPFQNGGATPRAFAYRLPLSHVLVSPEGESPAGPAAQGLEVVDRDQVVGRAWAKFYPILDRRLLD